VNNSGSAHWKLKPCTGYLTATKVVSKLHRLGHEKVTETQKNYAEFGPGHVRRRTCRRCHGVVTASLVICAHGMDGYQN